MENNIQILNILILAIIQGVTEFFPVSSSAHLVLFSKISGQSDQGLMIDVFLHLGSFFAVLAYFYSDVRSMLLQFSYILKKNNSYKGFVESTKNFLLTKIILATIPILVVGFFAYDFVEEYLRNPKTIAWATIIFAIPLFYFDKKKDTKNLLGNMPLPQSLIIGLAQTLALVPGVSRSGITMTASRSLGYNRSDSARFSILLSLPTILGAAALSLNKIIDSGNFQFGLQALTACILSFITSYLAIAFLMKWLKKATFTPFVIYRISFGIILLLWF